MNHGCTKLFFKKNIGEKKSGLDGLGSTKKKYTRVDVGLGWGLLDEFGDIFLICTKLQN